MRAFLLLTCFQFLRVFSVGLMAEAPDWQVNAENYQYNMAVVSQVYLDLTAVNTGNNVLGAFVGEELRGVAYPIELEGMHYYFLTVFSNFISGDSVTFKVYLESVDSIFGALEIVEFHKDACVGGITDPLHINISLTGDFPIALLPLPADTTLDGIPFDAIYLPDYVVSYDQDPLSWSLVPGPNLSASVINDQLVVDPASPGWTGTDSILIIARETGTMLEHADSIIGWFTVLPNYLGPEFTFIPAQFAADNIFPDTDLNNFLLYAGDSLGYAADIVRFEDTLTAPSWIPPQPGAGSMNLVIRLRFNGQPFNAPGLLGGFVNNQLAGVAVAVPVGDDTYYFLTLANVNSGPLAFQFYDNTYQYLYTPPSGLVFIPGGSAGSVSSPVEQELSPMTIGISPQGVWSADILDTNFTGTTLVDFRARDLAYPSKRDSSRVPFIWNQCAYPTWAICPGEGLCATADTGLVAVVWFRNGQPVHARQVLSIFQPGIYHYQGLKANGAAVLSCPLSVGEGQSCSGTFPGIHFPTLALDTLTLDNGLTLAETAVEVNPFDVRWNGNGGNAFWTTPGNWEFGVVPNQCQHVIIPVGFQVTAASGTNAQVWRLTVKAGAMLSVDPASELNILGN